MSNSLSLHTEHTHHLLSEINPGKGLEIHASDGSSVGTVTFSTTTRETLQALKSLLGAEQSADVTPNFHYHDDKAVLAKLAMNRGNKRGQAEQVLSALLDANISEGGPRLVNAQNEFDEVQTARIADAARKLMALGARSTREAATER